MTELVDLLRCALPTEPDERLAAVADKPFLRDAALEALAAARKKPSWATPTLARFFRRTRRLGSRDRKLVQDAVLGVIRHESFLLRAGLFGDEALLAGWGRLQRGDRFDAVAAGEPAEDYAAALSLGYRIARDWLEVLGPVEAAALARAVNARAEINLRANRLRCDRDGLAARLADEGVATRPHPRAPDGLVVEGRGNLTALASFREGWFEVQDASSQLLCAAIPVAPGQRIVDVCAGAGGKSLALAARGARVEAWDVREQALDELERRAARAGADVRIVEPSTAPVVLVDAPCSGTGRLRRDPALRWGLEQGRHLDAQAELVAAAAGLVEPGGLLVYATCSLLAEENAHAPPSDDGPWSLVEARELWPHRDGTDGFAWRMWRREA
jgi:16S rRNA (cytosine967-C5)-methyltransferase